MSGLFKMMAIIAPITFIIFYVVMIIMKSDQTKFELESSKFDKEFKGMQTQFTDSEKEKSEIKKEINNLDAQIQKAEQKKLTAEKSDQKMVDDLMKAAEKADKEAEKELEGKPLVKVRTR